MLVRELLLALGKDHAALARLGPRRLAELAVLWLRAEQVAHLVVLRAHRLPAATLHALEDLSEHAGVVVWAVAHRPGPVGLASLPWPAAVTFLRDACKPSSAATDPTEIYGQARDLARRAGRTWRLYGQRTMKRVRGVREGSELAQLLQPLTIHAHDHHELRLRLHASVLGLRDEGLHLAVPDLNHRCLQRLGPRFSADTVARLRRIACPVSVGAMTLALATDQDVPNLACTREEWTQPDGHHVRTTSGTFRIPPQARPMIRALLEHHATRSVAAPALLVAGDGTAMLGRRIAHAVNAAAKLSGLHPGSAEYAREKR